MNKQELVATVLLVEDETKFNLLLSEYLSRKGYAIISYKDSDDCLSDLKSRNISPFDIAIIDYFQGTSDTKELLEYLQSFCQSIPLISISGWPHSRFNSIIHFTKPFKVEKLEEKIRELLHIS